MERPILWKPNEGPQTFVLGCPEKEILYGGSRGGGKTDAGIARLLNRIDNPKLRVLVLRDTYDDLVDRIDRAYDLYQHYGAVKSGLPVQIRFPSGATIRTGYLKGQSYDKYKGHEYQKMIIEEVTQIPGEDNYEKLLGSLRSTVDGIDPQIFLTTNPDGVGRLWVKRRFVDVTQPNETYTDPEGNTRIFVPARLYDNPILMEKDPGYIKYLQGIKDDQLRQAWLNGDWDAYDVKGSIYSAQLKQTRNENRICKLPYDPDLPVYAIRDLGVADYMAIALVQFYAKEARFIDSLTGQGEGMLHYVREIEETMGYKIKDHFLPHDANNKAPGTGLSAYDVMINAGHSCKLLSRASDLWADINLTRSFFPYCWFDQNKCKTLLEHIEIYRKERDEKYQTFKDQPHHGQESHFADVVRYVGAAFRQYIMHGMGVQELPKQNQYSSITGRPQNNNIPGNQYRSKDPGRTTSLYTKKFR